MIDNGDYFTINRARQYGKTTILRALVTYLKDDYKVISLDFQRLDSSAYKSVASFVMAVSSELLFVVKDIPEKIRKEIETFENGTVDVISLQKFFRVLSKWCASCAKPMVLLVDEVDTATNNQIFLDFLAQLRAAYLDRDNVPTFQSVVLAGVYDVKDVKRKIRLDEEHKTNSPWNIAANFDLDMSFSAAEIADMLSDYKNDHHINMNIEEMSAYIYDYTSGYPYLVSFICKILDEMLLPEENVGEKVWSENGIIEAVGIILRERSTLFDSLSRQIDEHQAMQDMLKNILFQGSRYSYNIYNDIIHLGSMFGYMKNRNGSVAVSNRIFEMWLYNLFLSEDELKDITYDEAQRTHNQFIQNNRLNMDLVLQKFVIHFTDVYGNNDRKFLEENGRKLFLLYLKPIINGTGHYYIEAETRDMDRTDVIVDYLGQQFVIELKIWRGAKYHADGEKQLTGYLDYYRLKKGYMLSFCFNKNKEIGIKEIKLGDRVLIEAVV